MILQVDTYEKHFRETIPLFQNEEFITLCRNYGQASKEQKNELYKKFGELDIEPEEQLSLKPGIDPKDWRVLVNYHK